MTTPARLLSLVPFGLSAALLWPALANAGAPAAKAAPADEAAAPAAGASGDASVAVGSGQGSGEGSGQGSGQAEGPAKAEPEPSQASKDALPWKLRVGIVAQTREKGRKDVPWIKRWAPERLMAEVGLFGGMLFPAGDHDFYDPASGHKPLWQVSGEVGLRAAFFPERYIGVEVEGAGVVARVRTSTDDIAPLWAARGHVIAQLPWWNVAPFVLVGAGAMGVASNPIILGNDVDPAVHWGGGVKLYLHRYIALRVEGRHVLAAKQATQNSFTSHAEFLAGLSFTLGRAKPMVAPPPDPDRDKDGFLNERDDCPDTPGVSPDGCPPRDSDKDGFFDTEDACPYEAGVEPDGCPIRDQDGDGIPDSIDACKTQPETDNGFEDEDGCPDELPTEMREFSGIIQGIEFATDSSEITDATKPVLDRAIKVLTDYPDIRIEIVGHTDNQGTVEHNLELSKDRAESVKQYLVEGGVDAERLETRGAGQKEPVASNDTPEGQAKNRRTEFKLIKVSRAK
ncbi:Outer membrane lipoprotein omp16 precursor [Enhygromyxa salina]|uniref:Outer membrane lipoprotein omp16 n=1 Tax=Enhygromyxa salina TaxID=215803 RepID=A0A0C2DC12_9BACT|nr:OmpA family protein [Enhygromyxa salina]KIG17247.1 Outer membrane lipoprotein omp16 precursor [Enhygromyxa salina]